ncbi:MAG: TIGR03747 family integrating conjugative element membrane protein [Methylomonas sp.]|jgi:integrating conjugative element membrane protein (TIGR03747 family)|uniref:TIGR03747 family integrating conjugative element membrane protein n=1 Tax=Methylomonas sp. TaxID=418 RepID=UPI0025D38E49|nr:TIGR03747 family integrating conjugative element membrane protein [Methylomonas sp.]MCK9608013.1 TIGR03747 family integrating conjugative element membrane protein [Methylomonas sp.]
MAAPAVQRSSAQQAAEQGILARLVTQLLQALIFLIMTLGFSIATEWTGMATGFWDEAGTQHSQTMLEQELSVLNADFRRSVIVEQPVQFARRFADNFYDLIFRKTGIESLIIALAKPTQDVDDGGFRQRLRHYYQLAQDYMLAAMLVTQVFAVRLAVLILALPAFVLLGLMGLIDGLVQRDIRRWSGGRESSFVYHWAKKLLYPALILPWILYLAIPSSIHPNLIVLPFAILFALSIRVMASTFKKYL